MTRLDAIEVAEEIFAKLQQEKFLESVPNKNRFSFYIDLLLKQQNAMFGKSLWRTPIHTFSSNCA